MKKNIYFDPKVAPKNTIIKTNLRVQVTLARSDTNDHLSVEDIFNNTTTTKPSNFFCWKTTNYAL